MKKVEVIVRGYAKEGLVVVDAWWIELEDDVEVFPEVVWDLVNWSVWCKGGKPREVDHLLVSKCPKRDYAYCADGVWYLGRGKKIGESKDECVKVLMEDIEGNAGRIEDYIKDYKPLIIK